MSTTIITSTRSRRLVRTAALAATLALAGSLLLATAASAAEAGDQAGRQLRQIDPGTALPPDGGVFDPGGGVIVDPVHPTGPAVDPGGVLDPGDPSQTTEPQPQPEPTPEPTTEPTEPTTEPTRPTTPPEQAQTGDVPASVDSDGDGGAIGGSAIDGSEPSASGGGFGLVWALAAAGVLTLVAAVVTIRARRTR